LSGFADLFRRQLFGYPEDSKVYKRSRAGVDQVWSQLKSIGLDMTFLLNTLIDTPLDSVNTLISPASTGLEKQVKGLGLENI
jgi:hypothetical protein